MKQTNASLLGSTIEVPTNGSTLHSQQNMVYLSKLSLTLFSSTVEQNMVSARMLFVMKTFKR